MLMPACSITVEGGTATGVVTTCGREHRGRAVLVNADPFRLRQLAGADSFPADFNKRLDSMCKDGTTMKVRSSTVATAAALPPTL